MATVVQHLNITANSPKTPEPLYRQPLKPYSLNPLFLHTHPRDGKTRCLRNLYVKDPFLL